MNNSEKIYSGKTKDLYALDNGNILLVFKDDVTGADGVIDPGANTVIGQVEGKGRKSLAMTDYFFARLHAADIPTHMVEVDLAQGTMEVRRAEPLGKDISGKGGLEFICRTRPWGSFQRRYQNYIGETTGNLDYLVEITIKDDERGDPLINDDTIVALGLLSQQQLDQAKDLTRQVCRIVESDLADKGLGLIDMKIEIGFVDGEVVVIDEVSADAMRVMDGEGKVMEHGTLYEKLIR
ncbi:phosphoribosylaminoimidazolesuccinocarboxamide synthase [Pseudomonas saudimassiliensis]|uniref:phosphoribosylaminoimidazolesuccinocarboxamide synthase n=1 Tax=Pseudomonas saudimassiliensis TaxID=1461581 RepID=A0A078M9M5_9PSED|nr:phosphoribosylaminoimidazolesuccinocarboxamide synthase [Pseudomonas saudimassiliensis]CEA03030.1 phosphoribosylaminoimidazolesuccinocarboxamide synthase [Pseudomonas saudimassiliensis]CEF26049.1 phosphoribosylaminoimidazolesuccinocarboxamide synthase [Pseudomonas saudimassiliensis]